MRHILSLLIWWLFLINNGCPYLLLGSLQMELYKYIKSEFIDSALSQGCFRLGTLLDYQDEERHGEEIGEREEGLINLHAEAWDGKEIDLSSDTPEAQFIRSSLKVSKVDPWCKNKIRFGEGTHMVFQQRSKDGLIFCASRTFNPDVMNQFKCDACIVIKDAHKFFKSISNHIESYATFRQASKITYMPRNQLLRSTTFVHPAFLKPTEYRHQDEYRAAWGFKPGLPASPVIIKVPDCTKYIERCI